MAQVIEFYVPTNFQRKMTAAPQLQQGKLIEFCQPVEKSA